MVTKRILEELPDLYGKMFPQLFQELIPRETWATCDDCAMCAKPGEPRLPKVGYFTPDAKCCSYHPKLPNYLVGGVLSDTSPGLEEGRRRIREKIRDRVGVNPQGIFPPKKYAILFRYGDKSFGKNTSLLCPYFVRDSGLCSIWKFRESVCSTFFCKSVAGQDGKNFWNALKSYLAKAQESLIWYALRKLDCDIDKMWEYLNAFNTDTLEPEDLDEKPPDPENYKKLWGEWAGREEEFYCETFRIISNISAEEFEQIAGVTQKVLEDWVKKKRQDMIAPQIPPVLCRDPGLIVRKVDEEYCMVLTGTGFFKIKSLLNEVVQLFDGVRPNAEVVQLISERYGESLEYDLLRSLYQNRVLIEP